MINLDTLLKYTQFGLLFPLGDNSKKSRPRWAWSKRRSDDVAQIIKWHKKYPKAGWALIATRCLVIDIDVKDGATGPESIRDAGGLTPTKVTRTPSGGMHYYYALDPMVAFRTKNGWLPGVDLRYGPGGYVVLPGSCTDTGSYDVVTDVPWSELPPMPEWIKAKLTEESPWTYRGSRRGRQKQPTTTRTAEADETDGHKTKEVQVKLEKRSNETPDVTLSSFPSLLCKILKCNSGVRDQVMFMYFRKLDNGRIWHHFPIGGMKERTQSGYEVQLAIRWMNVGATDDELAEIYAMWCAAHAEKYKVRWKKRFFTSVIPTAREATHDYIAEWTACQPKRRKHGTTNAQIIEAILTGAAQPKEIVKETGLKGSAVRAMLKRMVDAGKLIKGAHGYAIRETACRVPPECHFLVARSLQVASLALI